MYDKKGHDDLTRQALSRYIYIYNVFFLGFFLDKEKSHLFENASTTTLTPGRRRCRAWARFPTCGSGKLVAKVFLTDTTYSNAVQPRFQLEPSYSKYFNLKFDSKLTSTSNIFKFTYPERVTAHLQKSWHEPKSRELSDASSRLVQKNKGKFHLFYNYEVLRLVKGKQK